MNKPAAETRSNILHQIGDEDNDPFFSPRFLFYSSPFDIESNVIKNLFS